MNVSGHLPEPASLWHLMTTQSAESVFPDFTLTLSVKTTPSFQIWYFVSMELSLKGTNNLKTYKCQDLVKYLIRGFTFFSFRFNNLNMAHIKSYVFLMNG